MTAPITSHPFEPCEHDYSDIVGLCDVWVSTRVSTTKRCGQPESAHAAPEPEPAAAHPGAEVSPADRVRAYFKGKRHYRIGAEAEMRSALEIALEALERHRPYGIYDECGHEHSDGDPGTLIVEDVGTVCEEGRVSTVCYVCHTKDGELCYECEDWQGEWPCLEFKAIERMADVLDGRDG